MFCYKCGLELKEEASFCHSCGNKLNHKKNEKAVRDNNSVLKTQKNDGTKKVKNFFISGILILFFIFVIGLSATVAKLGVSAILDYFRNKATNEETTKMVKDVFEDASKGTNKSDKENQKYVEIARDVLTYYRTESSKLLLAYEKLKGSDVLEYSSFKSENQMLQMVADINVYLTQLNNYQTNLDRVINETKNIVLMSELSNKDYNGLEK